MICSQQECIYNFDFMYTTVQKFGISKTNYTFIQQDCIIWLKRDNKDAYNGTKYFNKKNDLILKSELDVIRKSWKKTSFYKSNNCS